MAHFIESSSFSPKSVENHSAGWVFDKGFLGLVAALDMYLVKFQSAKEALLRYCTLSSRMKGATALNDLFRTATLLGPGFGPKLLPSSFPV